MKMKKVMATALAAVMLVSVLTLGVGTVGYAAPVTADAPVWNQEIIDAAVATTPVSMQIGAYSFGNTMYASQAMYILALAAYYNPELTATNGTKVADRLVKFLQTLTEPGKAPSARGALGGWVDNPVAQAITLASKTPAVWEELTRSEKERIDFIMKVLTVSSNYHENYVNFPATDFSQTYDWNKSWNPNHQEGCVGMMIAAYFYFGGADKVNSVLTSFDFDKYVAQMEAYGYADMKKFFETTGKTLIEKGGTDARGGTVQGVKVPFTYKSLITGEELAYDPLQIYKHLAAKMYSGGGVRSEVKQGDILRGYIMDHSRSPFEGQIGMAYEFVSMDANGIRTDAGYVNDGWRNSVPTRATLLALGVWDSEIMAETEKLMYVGSEDFLYKISPEHGGYKGYQKGQESGPTTTANFQNRGFAFYHEIWQKFVKNDYTATVKSAIADTGVTASYTFSNLSPFDQEFKLIAAAYDADGKLVSIGATKVAAKNGNSTHELTVATKAKAAKSVEFLWNEKKGLKMMH